jgi:plasmid stabilization system protein ParE
VKRARFVAAARREFLSEVRYYDQEQPGLGARFTKAVEEATKRAVVFPLAGAMAAGNTRRVSVEGFPFALIYRPDEAGIVIFAVAHHARSPGYWASRT